MRAIFSVAALLIVLAVVALVVRQQLAAVKVPELATSSANPSAAQAGASTASRQNVQQQLDRVRKDLDAAAQQSARQLEAAE